MTFENLKISINDQQPLDEVVGELERLGYECDQFYFHISDHKEKYKFKSIACYCSGYFYYHITEIEYIFDCKLTTLAELKEM